MMAAYPTQRPPLNDVQTSLIRLFSREMSDEETMAVRQLLIRFYGDQLHAEVEQVIAEKGYERTDFEQILTRQQRSK